MKAKPGGASVLREALGQVLAFSRAEAGNVAYTLHESVERVPVPAEGL
ncbi:putative quinol monooxygenase [Paenibacillus sp. UNC496MF]|nr:hypothetical protein [Paenibacillus sp. UNC496MF]